MILAADIALRTRIAALHERWIRRTLWRFAPAPLRSRAFARHLRRGLQR